MTPSLDDLLTIKAALVLGWLLAFFVLERLLPASPWRPLSTTPLKRLSSNGALWLVNAGIAPLLVFPVTLLAASQAIAWRPDVWGGWFGLLLDIILLDAWIYWWHRANHEVGFLWRFHQVHHLDEQLDSTSAVRFHFGEVVLSAFVRGVFIFFADLPILSVLVFETLVLMTAIFHHSNLKLPARLEQLLSCLIITPSIHWVHHHAVSADTDSNYGTVFSFWDKLFRSRSATNRTPNMVLGVSRHPELPLYKLMLLPFSSVRSGAGA